MRLIRSSRTLKLPTDVKVEVKSRKITVTGQRGTLIRDFSHVLANMYIIEEEGCKKLKIEIWFGTKKAISVIRTVITHVTNMITGVTKGYQYKMRLVYAHFPININIVEEKGEQIVEIRNFLGEKRVRIVKMLPGVEIVRSEAVKDELIITGNNVELVGRCCALIHQSCLVKEKDIRKFLDGIYVSEKGNVVQDKQ